VAIKRKRVDWDILDMIVRPLHKEKFFVSMWSKEQHIRVAARDSELKIKADLFILAFFDSELLEKMEFIE
jgi:hypothetical protein